MAFRDLSEAISNLIFQIEKGKNVVIVRKKASQTKDGVKIKNPALEYRDNWKSTASWTRTEDELARQTFFNDTERDLFFNYKSTFFTGKKETPGGGDRAGIRPLKPGEKKFYYEQWQPANGEPYWIQSFDPLMDCYEVKQCRGPQNNEQQQIAGRFVLRTLDMTSYVVESWHQANCDSVKMELTIPKEVPKDSATMDLIHGVRERIKDHNGFWSLELKWLKDPEIREPLRAELLRRQAIADGLYREKPVQVQPEQQAVA